MATPHHTHTTAQVSGSGVTIAHQTEYETNLSGTVGFQEIVVLVLFVVAAFFVLRKIWRQWSPGPAGAAACAKGCGACSATPSEN